MDKKTRTIVIIVVAVVVLGGASFGYNRWRQQRLAKQILANMYGINTGMMGGLTGGNIQERIAQEIIDQEKKDEEQQKKDEAEEAAKTPEDRYNETAAVSLTGQIAALVKAQVEPQLTAVFGKIKPTLFSNAYMGQENSFLITFKVPRVITSDDANKLVDEFTKAGYTSAMNSIGADSANLLMDSAKATISISYENPADQEIGVLYMEKSE
jgi:hypothetical protein